MLMLNNLSILYKISKTSITNIEKTKVTQKIPPQKPTNLCHTIICHYDL